MMGSVSFYQDREPPCPFLQEKTGEPGRVLSADSQSASTLTSDCSIQNGEG